MTSTRPRGRPRASDPATIREAALELFLEQGFERTTVDDIARRAGVARGTVFAYCDSKADALWEQLDDAIERASRAVADAGAAGPDAIAAMLADAVAPWGASPPAALRDAPAMGAVETLRDGAPGRLAPLAGRIAEAVALAGDELPEAPHPSAVAAGMLGSAAAALAAWAREPRGEAADAVLRAALRPATGAASR